MQKNNKKTLLITGADGFIGSKVAEAFEDTMRVVRVVNKKHQPKISRKTNRQIRIAVDVLDFNSLIKQFRIFKPEIVIHLAAKSTVEEGQEQPRETLLVNITGTLNVLELSRIFPVEKTIIASSVHVYGDNPDVPLKEDQFPQPSRPYETSKACSDIIAQTYAETYNLPVIIPRFVNIYGPGDLHFTRIIPYVIRSILTKKKVEVWGGKVVRDYLYIDDVLSAYKTILRTPLEKFERNRVINFGKGDPVSVVDIAQKLIDISGKDVRLFIVKDEVRPDEVKKLYVSFAKAKRILDWDPKFSLDEGLRQAWLWYKNYFNEQKR